jgi:cysteinyl-tRNA synthetase
LSLTGCASDGATVIGILTDLANDDTVPPGARFETFLSVDRVLALDLARHLGSVSPAATDHGV